jgi:hypothetical protein
VLLIEVYSGIVTKSSVQETELPVELKTLRRGHGEEPSQDFTTLLPKMLSVDPIVVQPSRGEHQFVGIDKSVGEAIGAKIVVKGQASLLADGKMHLQFTELGRQPAYNGATQLDVGAGETRVLTMPPIEMPDGADLLYTIVLIRTPPHEGGDQNGRSRFEAQ